MAQEIKNGIIIDGVIYTPVAAADQLRKCKKCALQLQCFRFGQFCRLFGEFLYYFVKLTDQDNGKEK